MRRIKSIAADVKDGAKRDNATLVAGGVAFYFFLALIPALIALISVWGLFADPETVTGQIRDIAQDLPSGAARLVTEQLNSIAAASSAGLSVGLVLGVVTALWSASSGIKNLITAVNAVYGEAETRGFVKLRGISLAFTAGAIVIVMIGFFLISALPGLLETIGFGDAVRTTFAYLRWPVIALIMIGALDILYAWGPDRREKGWRWASPGALLAVCMWLLTSILFTIYVGNFGSYNETYGALAGVVVLMLWLYLTALAFIFGAELNAVIEGRTVRHPDDSSGDGPGPTEPAARSQESCVAVQQS